MSSIENFNGVKKNVLLVCVSIILLFLTILTIEFIAYLSLQMILPKHSGRMTLTEFLLTKPLPFVNAEDYDEVRRDWNKETNCPQNRIIYDKSKGFPRYEIANVACDGPITLSNGLRTTIGSSTNAKNKILLFGGSTMWGTGSADRNTIPSLMQKHIIESKLDFDVINYGFPAIILAQQINLLKNVEIKLGDIVIFYDGGNDIWNSAVYGNPMGGIIGYNDSNKLLIMINRFKFFLSNHSNLYKLLGYIKNSDLSSSCLSIGDEIILSRSANGFDLYYENIKQAKLYTEAKGGKFFHFLQPSLVSNFPISQYKKDLIAEMDDETRCGINAYAKGYALFKQKYSAVRDQISGTDLTSIFDKTNYENEFFWDHIHVSSPANIIISRTIFDSVIPKVRD